MIAKLFGADGFMDLLSTPSFWYTLVLLIGLIILLVSCFKYPKIGGPVLLGVFFIGLIALTVYSLIQLNIYYNAKGGIHGAITGIFNTNKIEVVDDLTFELKNIELTESSDGKYSASISINQVVSLDTRESLGVFVNDMPCDTTSEVQTDYAIAEYVYSFYDEDKSLICTDTLTLNFAFYDESTYLKVSTDGGTLPVEECIKYWHYYFNKNGFIVKIAPFESINTDIEYTAGDVTNYAVVTFIIDDEIQLVDVYPIGSKLEIPEFNDNVYVWYIDGTEVTENTIITKSCYVRTSIDNIIENYYVRFQSYDGWVTADSSVTAGEVVPAESVPTADQVAREGYTFAGWSVDGINIIDITTYVPTRDTTFIPIYYYTSQKIMTLWHNGQAYTPNDVDEFYLNNEDDISVDYVNSTFRFYVYSAEGMMNDRSNAYAIDVKYEDLGKTITVDSANTTFPAGNKDSGSFTFCLNLDGTIDVDPGDYKLSYSGSSNLSSSLWTFSLGVDADIRILTK